MKVLITGCSGFIGSHLSSHLSSSHDVVGFDLAPPETDIDFVQGDINDTPLLEKTLPGIDTVFHLAALPEVAPSSRDPARFFKANTEGTFNLLFSSLKSGVERFIFASSSAVYGRSPLPSKERDPVRPVSIYAADKAAGEAYCSAFSELGLPTVILRLFNLYGAGNLKGVMHDFATSLSASPSLKILGDGSQSKDFLHVSDAVKAFSLATSLPPGIYNVGSGEQTSIKEIAKIIADELDISPELFFTGSSWKGDVYESLADISKLESHGWSPQVPLEDGLRRYVRWLTSST